MSDNPSATGAQVTNAFNTGQGPDGRTWGVILFGCGPITFQMTVPPDAIEQYVNQYKQELDNLVAQVKRANLPLQLATEMPTFDPSVFNRKGI